MADPIIAAVTAKPELLPPVPQTIHAFTLPADYNDENFNRVAIVYAELTALCGKQIGYAPARWINVNEGAFAAAVASSSTETCDECEAITTPETP